MAERTFKLCISIFCCLFLLTTPVVGQDKKRDKKKDNPNDTIIYPLFDGISIGYDILGPINKAYNKKYLTHEISIDVSLKNRYFPVLELGYGSANKWSDHGIHYKSKAPYFRIGADYNFFHKKAHKHILSLGFRYGYSSFDYDIKNLPLDDDVWGNDVIENPSINDDIWGGSISLDKTRLSSSMHWLEFVLGVRTSIYKNLQMAITFRMKYRVSIERNPHGDPWYIPGFGNYDNSRAGINYSIIYRIPGSKRKVK